MGRVLFAVFLLITNNSLAGQAYMWTDKDGNVHFSDRQPQGQVEVDKIKLQNSSEHKITESRAKPRDSNSPSNQLKSMREAASKKEQERRRKIVEKHQATIKSNHEQKQEFLEKQKQLFEEMKKQSIDSCLKGKGNFCDEFNSAKNLKELSDIHGRRTRRYNSTIEGRTRSLHNY